MAAWQSATGARRAYSTASVTLMNVISRHAVLLVQLGSRHGIHLKLESWYREYGPIYKFYLGRAPIVVVTGQQTQKLICSHMQNGLQLFKLLLLPSTSTQKPA